MHPGGKRKQDHCVRKGRIPRIEEQVRMRTLLAAPNPNLLKGTDARVSRPSGQSGHWPCHQVSDNRRFVSTVECSDPLLDLEVGHRQPFMLAQMFDPGFNDK